MITITRDGQTFGPYSETQILDLVRDGEISRNELAWRDGLTDWQPLKEIVDLGMPPLPLPVRIQDVLKKSDAEKEKIIFNDRGILVTNQQVKIGSNVFVVRNIGGVSINQIATSRGLPLLGMMIFGFMALVSWMSASQVGVEKGGFFIFLIIMFGPLALFSAAKFFRRPQHVIQITASGGMQRAFTSTDKAFVEKVAQAIQKAIL